jgi:hypothetical protein
MNQFALQTLAATSKYWPEGQSLHIRESKSKYCGR